MRAAGVDLELAQHGVAERPLGQHALHGLLQHALGMRRVQLAEARFLQAAGKSAMPVIRLALNLAAGKKGEHRGVPILPDVVYRKASIDSTEP